MTTHTAASTRANAKFSLQLAKSHKLLMTYLLLLTVPLLAAQMLKMDFKGWYSALLSLVNMLAMMAFFVQFPLASRIRQFPLFANIDWSMSRHQQIGKWLGVIFLLHPLLILTPRFLLSFNDGISSLMTTLTAPQMLTGIIAWVAMILWVLFAIYKEKLPLRYESWRLLHLFGFIAIAILATLHITSVGRHGQFQAQFNLLWWGLCGFALAMVIYNYLFKPARLQRQPFKLTEVTRLSSSDWQVTIEKQQGSSFHFEAGQFVWLNTSGSAHSINEHPFSIASCEQELPRISFIIRELGDYTRNIGSLTPGQKVYIDGPYGSISLNDSNKNKGITLIAGGAGIAPMLSLLRALAENRETRPVRLIYGNSRLEQMVLLDEIKALEEQMTDFKLQLVCQENTKQNNIYSGVIDQQCIANNIDPAQTEHWAIYLCGPQPMIAAVKRSLKALGIPNAHIHYEQLSF